MKSVHGFILNAECCPLTDAGNVQQVQVWDAINRLIAVLSSLHLSFQWAQQAFLTSVDKVCLPTAFDLFLLGNTAEMK